MMTDQIREELAAVIQSGLSVSDRIEAIRELNCDQNCKWPVIYDKYDDDEKLLERCEECPMRWL